MTQSVRAVERAIDVLTSFDADRAVLEIADLQATTKLSRPTLYRLLQTLEKKGFIHSYGNPLRFELGPAVQRLAHAWDRSFPVVSVSRPILEDLWRQTNETIALTLPIGTTERTCVIELKSPQPVSFSRGTGYTEALHRGASGKAILAFSPPAIQAEVLSELRTRRDRESLKDELEKIRRAGYATTFGELIEGVASIAVPVLDQTGRIHASVCVFGTQTRLKGSALKACIKSVVTAARRIQAKLDGGTA